MKATEKDCRDVGMTANALQYPKDELALIMFCAFNNVRVDQIRPGHHFFPNESTRAAWNRVAEAAYAAIRKED